MTAPAGVRRCRAARRDFRRSRHRAVRPRDRLRYAWAKGCALTGDCIAACRLTASIRASCWRWRASPWRGRLSNCASGASAAWRICARSPTASTCCRACSSRRRTGAARPAGDRPPAERLDGEAGRAARFRFLHRLQCAQDAAHGSHSRSTSWTRSASLIASWAGRRHCCGVDPVAHRRYRSLRPRRHQFARQVRGRQNRRHLLVRELPRAIHRGDAADDRKDARRPAVRDDALHAVPAGTLRATCGRCSSSRCRCASRA